jgi:hypothetical protein
LSIVPFKGSLGISSILAKGSTACEGRQSAMSQMMHEQRREARAPQNKTGVIRFGAAGHELPCIVIDLTPRGAGITLGSAFGVPQVFQLTINGETEVRHCRVSWAQGRKLGVSFE